MKEPLIKKVDGFLQSIFTKVKMLETLSLKITTHLDEPLQKQCQVANLTNNCLVLIVPNGSVATQLRFLSPDLLRKFKTDSQLARIREIQIKVRPFQPERRVTRISNKPKPISIQSANIMCEIAETIDDPKLKEVLQRLAKNTKR